MTNTVKKLTDEELAAYATELSGIANKTMSDEVKRDIVNKFMKQFDLSKERLEAERELVNYDLIELEQNIKAATTDPLSYFEKNGPFQFKKSEEHLKAEERYKNAFKAESDSALKIGEKSKQEEAINRLISLLAADINKNKNDKLN